MGLFIIDPYIYIGSAFFVVGHSKHLAGPMPCCRYASGKKTESNGLALPATGTFQPITTLTTNIHIDKPYSVFVHYQITLVIID